MRDVKRKIRMLCVIFLGAALSIAARIGEPGTDEVIRGQDEYTLPDETGYVETNAVTDEVQRDLGEYTPAAGISYVETETRQEENELIFGDLIIELPEGVHAEIEAADDTGPMKEQLISLAGAEELDGTQRSRSTAPFPPQIGMAYYHIEYEHEEALACALLDLLLGGNLRVLYRDEINDEYIFRMGEEVYADYYHYVFVRGEDVYLVGEFDIEKLYSFSNLWKQGNVRWQDSKEAIEYQTDIEEAYYKTALEEDIPVLCHDYSGDLNFYLEGYYDNCYASCQLGGFMYSDRLTDVNFDGCTDIRISYDNALLWDADKREFIQAVYPEDMPLLGSVSFPETKTIWCFDRGYLRRTSGNPNKYYAESLWQWEGLTPVKKRELVVGIGEDGVRIRAYEGTAHNIMFDEDFTLEAWDNGSDEDIRALFEQFYDGLVPQEYFFPEEEVPQELLDEITDAMKSGTEREMLEDMMVLTVLSDEECYELARKNGDIRVNVLEAWQYGSCILAAADIDNDGMEDILDRFYGGGSSGDVEYILFQGQADGSYIETDTIYSRQESFDVICYDGKNYFLRMTYNYGKKTSNGLCLTVYREGVYTEEVQLTLYAGDYDLALVRSEEGYEALAREVIGNAVLYDEMAEEYKNIVGSAEEFAKDDVYPYSCDLDNDGETEYYDKYIWASSSIGTEDGLSFSCQDEEDEGVALIQEAMQERRPKKEYAMMLWADETDGETVVNVMYRTGFEDFVIVGYVVNDLQYREVYEITADVVLKVRQTRYPRNYRSEHAHASTM